MNAVRLGMVTLWRPWEFLNLQGIKPEDRTRKEVNAAIRAKAARTGAKSRYLKRENKPAGRVDTGDRIKSLRKRVIDGAVIARALEMGGFYAQLILTRETTGSEQKFQICQGQRPEGRDGVLDNEQFEELVP